PEPDEPDVPLLDGPEDELLLSIHVPILHQRSARRPGTPPGPPSREGSVGPEVLRVPGSGHFLPARTWTFIRSWLLASTLIVVPEPATFVEPCGFSGDQYRFGSESSKVVTGRCDFTVVGLPS